MPCRNKLHSEVHWWDKENCCCFLLWTSLTSCSLPRYLDFLIWKSSKSFLHNVFLGFLLTKVKNKNFTCSQKYVSDILVLLWLKSNFSEPFATNAVVGKPLLNTVFSFFSLTLLVSVSKKERWNVVQRQRIQGQSLTSQIKEDKNGLNYILKSHYQLEEKTLGKMAL